MPPGLGHKSYLQIGPKESTYGTYIAPTAKLELMSWDVNPNVGVIQDPSLYSQQSRRALYQGLYTVGGTFKVRLNYEGLLEIFRGIFGNYPAPTTVETGVRDHFFKEGATLNSYSPEVIIGDVTTNKCFRMLGSKFIGLRVAGRTLTVRRCVSWLTAGRCPRNLHCRVAWNRSRKPTRSST